MKNLLTLFAEKKFYKTIFVFIITAVFGVTGVTALSAQDRVLHKNTLSDSSVVSMVTVYPGNKIYSLFGHSAFRVYDPENKIDLMYNYGTFDFTDSFFVLRFIEGKLDYYLDIGSFSSAYRFYSNIEKRKIFEQILNFDLKKRQALFDFLEENGKPENRIYRYDFIWDNCSTRIAGAIDKTFPDLVDFSAYKGSGESFRKMIMHYLGEKPFTNFGIQLVLGKSTDRIPIGHELFFLPIYMKQAFSAAVIKNKEGAPIPLVAKEAMIASPELVFHKKSNYPFFIFLSVLIIYFVSLVLQFGKNGKNVLVNLSNKNTFVFKMSGTVSALCEGFVFLFAGIIGLLITYLWFFSEHRVASSNLNFFWCTPLNLILFVGMFLKKKKNLKKLSLFFSCLSLVILVFCAAYLVCVIFGMQYVHPAFVPIIIFLIAANIRRLEIKCCFKFKTA